MTDDLIALTDRVMHEGYREVFRAIAGARIQEQDGMLMCAATSRSPAIVNSAFRVTQRLTATQAVAAAADLYAGLGHGFGIFVADHDEDGLLDAATAAGLEPFVELSVMVLGRKPDVPAAPAGVILVRVEDQAGLAAYAQIIAAAFAPHVRELYSDLASVVGQDRGGWVAYRDGEPASCAGMVVVHGVGLVVTVGTLAEQSRRGLGGLVTRVAAAAAFDLGAALVTLQSSPEGLKVYERIGFRTISRYRVLGRGEPGTP